MNYLIIDDEPIAHDLIQKFASEFPDLKCVANCYSALEAIPILNEKQIDLIFLDMELPKLKGFDFLRSLAKPPQIIVISAHKEFALEGYEFNITDYLLKPFNFERFVKSIQKAMQHDSVDEKKKSDQSEHIFIKDEKKHHKVSLSQIKYIEASGNYSIVYLDRDRIMTQMKISDFEQLLPPSDFTRCHRSFLVSNSFITLIKASEIHIGNITIPVGRVYKENVQRILEN